MSPDSERRPRQEASSSASATQIAEQRTQFSVQTPPTQSRIPPAVHGAAAKLDALLGTAKGDV